MRHRQLFVALLFLLLGVTIASAQEAAVGAGKLEIGGFPGGGLIFGGGDDNTEADFGIYSFGGGATWYANQKLALEGELSGGPGIAQNVTYRQAFFKHRYVPNVRNFNGNLLFFPGGTAGKSMPYYVTAGAGVLSLMSRDATGVFGYDPDERESQAFTATNFGGGIKIFRGSEAPQWGFRADYRLFIVSANSSAPEFFAQQKTRTGHRFYLGLLYTAKR